MLHRRVLWAIPLTRKVRVPTQYSRTIIRTFSPDNTHGLQAKDGKEGLHDQANHAADYPRQPDEKKPNVDLREPRECWCCAQGSEPIRAFSPMFGVVHPILTEHLDLSGWTAPPSFHARREVEPH